jgi:hypothetical protein
MADDVLRMRATLVSDETLAGLRAIGREIGLMPQKVKGPIKDTNTELGKLTEGMKKFGEQTLRAVPALEEWGLGAAGAGAAAGVLIHTLSNISKQMVDLSYRSKELGMSERDIRAWMGTAEKAGISAQSMLQSLTGFRNTTEGLKYNIGGVRDQLYSLGAGPIVRAMQGAANEGERLKSAFTMKDVLWKESPWKAQQFFQMVGLGADAARLSYQEYVESTERRKPFSKEDEDRAKKFHDSLVELGEAWDELSTKAAVALFPGLTKDIANITWVIDHLGALKTAYDEFIHPKGSPPPITVIPENPILSLGLDPNAPFLRGLRALESRAQKRGAATGGRLDLLSHPELRGNAPIVVPPLPQPAAGPAWRRR